MTTYENKYQLAQNFAKIHHLLLQTAGAKHLCVNVNHLRVANEVPHGRLAGFLSLSQDDLHVKPKKLVMLILPIRQSGSAFGQSRLKLHAIGRLITPFYASFVHGCQAQVDDI